MEAGVKKVIDIAEKGFMHYYDKMETDPGRLSSLITRYIFFLILIAIVFKYLGVDMIGKIIGVV